VADLAGLAGLADLAVPVGEGDHSIGPPGAPATLVIYGDYECPYTFLAMPVVRALLSHFGERLRFVFRHFPLQKHPHAYLAAEAAEAAGAQGRFWEMHVALFNHQAALAPADLARYAAELGLDLDRFRADLAGHTPARRIAAGIEGGRRSGVTGTPTYFLNGSLYDGDDRLSALTRAVQGVLDAAPRGAPAPAPSGLSGNE
jgi:protein-disulfide isomerase